MKYFLTNVKMKCIRSVYLKRYNILEKKTGNFAAKAAKFLIKFNESSALFNKDVYYTVHRQSHPKHS